MDTIHKPVYAISSQSTVASLPSEKLFVPDTTQNCGVVSTLEISHDSFHFREIFPTALAPEASLRERGTSEITEAKVSQRLGGDVTNASRRLTQN